MSISDEQAGFARNGPTVPSAPAPFVVEHEGDEGMGARSMTVGRYAEIGRRLAEGRGLREIARALGCSRCTVRAVRDGERQCPDAPKALSDPLWMLELDWPAIVQDLGLGHPLKFLWEEKAQHLTTYSNFWKQFYRKFPQYREATVTAREFAPGERVEVDYAGDTIEWIEMQTGELRHAVVFVSGLGFSQLLFAWASEDMKSRNWLGAHRRMFTFYGGVCQRQSNFPHLWQSKIPHFGVFGFHSITRALRQSVCRVSGRRVLVLSLSPLARSWFIVRVSWRRFGWPAAPCCGFGR